MNTAFIAVSVSQNLFDVFRERSRLSVEANLISQYLIVSFYEKLDWYTGEIIVVDTEGKKISSPSLFGYFIRLMNVEHYKSSLPRFPQRERNTLNCAQEKSPLASHFPRVWREFQPVLARFARSSITVENEGLTVVNRWKMYHSYNKRSIYFCMLFSNASLPQTRNGQPQTLNFKDYPLQLLSAAILKIEVCVIEALDSSV